MVLLRLNNHKELFISFKILEYHNRLWFIKSLRSVILQESNFLGWFDRIKTKLIKYLNGRLLSSLCKRDRY